ncbi:MAG: hypothetical protein QOJ24_5029 [Mycobacterium sp.]|jgi:hypothetical protein|nr:hypothetical protein [Mycobacterium sp.]
MTSPESNDEGNEDDSQSHQVPPANPAYATPPPEGLPDADND